MAILAVNPTRMELSNLKKKLVTATRGYKLLKDKRDELMRQFLKITAENKALRIEVENAVSEAHKSMIVARSLSQEEVLDLSFLIPVQEITIETGERNIMSVPVPVFTEKYKTNNMNDIYSYGYAFTSGALDDAVGSYAKAFPLMLKLAQSEKTCQLLAAEIERTRRRVNALEHIIIPQYRDTIKYITMKLDENERSNIIRLMKVKDMVISKAHGK